MTEAFKRNPVAFANGGPASHDGRTLVAALDETARYRWRGMRSHDNHVSQAKIAIKTLGPGLRVCDVSAARLREARVLWAAQGLSPHTINKRFACLSALGVNIEGARARVPNRPKWWLTPAMADAIRHNYPAFQPGRAGYVLVNHIDWTEQTGFRVEETLRLRRYHFAVDFRSVEVPGEKTSGAQATLPLSTEATAIAIRCFGSRAPTPFASTPMLPISYLCLKDHWIGAMAFLGVDHPEATSRSVRRTAARTLSTKGVPIDMIRQYLRHRNIRTTMGYLTLTGGYGLDEYRKWLG